jgi:hypothetical protein
LLTSVTNRVPSLPGSLAGSRMHVQVHATHSAGATVKCGQAGPTIRQPNPKFSHVAGLFSCRKRQSLEMPGGYTRARAPDPTIERLPFLMLFQRLNCELSYYALIDGQYRHGHNLHRSPRKTYFASAAKS